MEKRGVAREGGTRKDLANEWLKEDWQGKHDLSPPPGEEKRFKTKSVPICRGKEL